MPVAAVAEIVVTSAASFRTIAWAEDVPLKVCVPVQVLLADKDTPAAGVVDCQVVPLEVSTLPVVPGATTWTADVPLPKMTLLAVKLVAPVPPDATPMAVDAVTVVNAPAAGVVPPIAVPSIVPPLMSAVVATKLPMFPVPAKYRLRHSWLFLPRS